MLRAFFGARDPEGATLTRNPFAKAALVWQYRAMPKQKKHDSDDVNLTAHRLVSDSTDAQLPSKAQISLLMASLGRKGGKIGGKRRLETMSAKQRQQIARKAAQARWKQEEE